MNKGLGSSYWMLLATVLVVAANLRPAISAVGPLMSQIEFATGLSPSFLGVLGALPVLGFGLVSPFVHSLGQRWGIERTVLVALIVLAFATALRSFSARVLGVESQTLTTLTLFLGAFLLSCAVGVGNVLLPAVVKRDFPEKVPLMTGLYAAVMAAAAALGSGAAVPLAAHFGWEVGLGASLLLTLAAIVFWSRRPPSSVRVLGDAVQKGGTSKTHNPTLKPLSAATVGTSSTVWRAPVAWWVTAYFALQSGIFYLVLTWLPAIHIERGIEPAQAGWLLSLYQAVGIMASLLLGPILQRSADQRAASGVVACLMMTAITGILLAPDWMVLWTVLGGFSTSSMLLIALTMISLRARHSSEASALSGMAQGIGYLCAACGPLAAGFAYELSGSWDVVLYGVLVVLMIQVVVGLFSGREGTL